MVEVVATNGSAHELQSLLASESKQARRQRLAETVYQHKSLLFIACLNRSPDLAEVLLSAGANASLGRMDEGTTPLHVSAGWLHHETIVELLLARADDVLVSIMAKPTQGGLRGHTPAWWAVHYRHEPTYWRLVNWMRSIGWNYVPETDAFELIGG